MHTVTCMPDLILLRMTPAQASQLLVKRAPMRGDFEGIIMRARYATTRPGDVLAQYRRTAREAALAYGKILASSAQDPLVCTDCGAANCKLWRKHHTDGKRLLCVNCVLLEIGQAHAVDEDGLYENVHGFGSTFGAWMAAIPRPTSGFWPNRGAPAAPIAWWRSMPTYPVPPASGHDDTDVVAVGEKIASILEAHGIDAVPGDSGEGIVDVVVFHPTWTPRLEDYGVDPKMLEEKLLLEGDQVDEALRLLAELPEDASAYDTLSILRGVRASVVV